MCQKASQPTILCNSLHFSLPFFSCAQRKLARKQLQLYIFLLFFFFPYAPKSSQPTILYHSTSFSSFLLSLCTNKFTLETITTLHIFLFFSLSAPTSKSANNSIQLYIFLLPSSFPVCSKNHQVNNYRTDIFLFSLPQCPLEARQQTTIYNFTFFSLLITHPTIAQYQCSNFDPSRRSGKCAYLPILA